MNKLRKLSILKKSKLFSNLMKIIFAWKILKPCLTELLLNKKYVGS